MNILVVGAHKLELESFRQHYEKISSINFGDGKVEHLQGGSVPVYLLQTGIGLEKAENSLRASLEYLKNTSQTIIPDLVLNFGLSGAIHPEREIGDLVIGTESISENQVNTIFRFDSKIVSHLSSLLKSKAVQFTPGRIFSSNKAISDEQTRTKIYQEMDAQVVDMEAAAIAQVCQQFEIPCGTLKYVSDNADQFVIKDFLAHYEEASALLGNLMHNFIQTLEISAVQ
jgi:adenosylhomocysteine nucleosidase